MDGGSKHARQDFWRWVAQWAVYIRKPSDLGFDDGGFVLPPLASRRMLYKRTSFPKGICSLGWSVVSRDARKRGARLLRNGSRSHQKKILNSDDQWLVWVGLNDEGQQLAKLSAIALC